jgi:hypothetical protein
MRKLWCAAAWTVVLAAVALSLGSCAIPAFFAAQFAPPQKVDALYDPPKGKTVLVFVDDILKPVSYEPIKSELARRLAEQLRTHKIAGKTVSYDRLADLMGATPDFNALAVSEVGQKLGADIVVYVHIDEFRLRDEAAEAQLWKGYLEVSVRMVDVTKGRLWPKDRQAGYVVPAVETPTTAKASDTYADELVKTLAAKMADRVAKLFYKHEVPHEGGWQE